MKSRLLCLILLFGNCLIFAQIRDSICIVTPQYSTETIKFINNLSEELGKAGYRDLSRKISGRLNSVFGSGVVINGKNNVLYVLTNQHVVSLADKAIIEFRNTIGETNRYENCEVFAVDEQLDLALIILPDTAKKHPAITLSSREVHDGDEVWSAGYPGLSGEPSWQFGKGNITNEAARVHDLIDPDLSVILQHSAPVDPGNSGGPLLQSIPGQKRIYAIVGINTWKVFFRQAANFAVPSGTIEAFLKRTTSSENYSMAALRNKTDFFIRNLSAISADNEEELRQLRNMYQFFSLDLIKVKAEQALLHALGRAPTHIRNDIIQNLVYSSLLDGIRIAIAWNLVEQMPDLDTKKQFSPVFPIESMNLKQEMQIRYSTDSQELISVLWKYNKHTWSVLSFDVIKTGNIMESTAEKSNKKKGTSSLSFEKPYSISIQGELSICDDIPFIGVNYGFFGRFLGGGGCIAVGILENSEAYGNGFLDTKIFNVFSFVKAQIPINFTSICINPFVSGRIGLSVIPGGHEEPEIKILPIAGVELVIKTTPSIIIGTGWAFDLKSDRHDYSGPFISLGIGL